VSSGTGSGGGGGGGGGGDEKTLFAETKDKFELLIGKEQSFKLPIENTYNYDKLNVKIEVKGINSEYISINPSFLNRIKAHSKEEVEIKITAPAYFTKGNYLLTFTLEGNLDLNKTTKFNEKKYVRLYMVDISAEKAEEYLIYSEKFLTEMENKGFIIKEIKEYFDKMSNAYGEVDYSAVQDNYQKFEEIYLAAINSQKLLEELRKSVEEAENRGLDVFETKKMLYVAETIFERGNYVLAYQNLKEAKTSFALETKGEINILYEIKNNPLEFSASLFAIALISFVSTASIRARNLRRKYRSLEKEEKILLDLMKVVQKDTFEKGKMSMEEYTESIIQYEKKLNNVISEKIKTQARLAHFLNLKGKRKALEEEKIELRKLLEETQRAYLSEGNIDTRVYQNMIKAYSSRLAKVEGELISAEVKSFFRKKRFSKPDFVKDDKKEKRYIHKKIKKEKNILKKEGKKTASLRKNMEKKSRRVK
jgi:hypothetical protein